MRAVRIHETGSPEVLKVEDVEAPSPAEGQVLIRVAVAGVNFTDVMARQGIYLTREATAGLPATLGTEVAGVVAAAGPGTPADLVGRRVIAFVQGGYAEYAIAPLALVTELPAGVDFAEAAAYLVQGVTAWQLLRDCGRIEPGQSVLVHSAAGGVGTLAVQLAKAFGASTVIATAGSADKRKVAEELGADVTVDYTLPDWPEKVLATTGGRGADISLEAVGSDIGERSLECLAPFGRLVVYGVSSKRLSSFAGSQLMHKNQSVVGYWLTSRLSQDGESDASTAQVVPRLLELVDEGRLRGVVRNVFPMERAADAHEAVSDRRSVGKVVLTT